MKRRRTSRRRAGRSPRPREWRGSLGLLAAALIAAGCQSTPDAGEAAERLRVQAFRGALVGSTEAINAGDLGSASRHLGDARERAATKAERNKITSLEKLIAGAEALMAGDPEAARTQWADIDDPNLSRELCAKARGVGMTIPTAPTTTALAGRDESEDSQ